MEVGTKGPEFAYSLYGKPKGTDAYKYKKEQTNRNTTW